VQTENTEPEKHGPRVLVKQHPSSGGGHLKWILIGAAAAGGAVATMGLRGHGGANGSAQSGGSGTVSSITPAGSPVVGPHP
jgi:hypothetical protein